MKLNKLVFLPFFALFIVFIGCGDDREVRQNRKKAVADSLRQVEVDAWNKASEANRKKAGEDSILAIREYNAQLVKYDSLREADSLRAKKKRHRGVKPAPKRELGGRSPVK